MIGTHRLLGCALALVALLSSLTASAQALDTVFLTSGGRVRGTVIADEPAGVTMQLPDGTTRKLLRAEVTRVEYAGSAAAPPPAAPAPTATVPGAPPPATPPATTCGRDADCSPDAYCSAAGACTPRAAPGPLGYAAPDTAPTRTQGIPALYIIGPIVLGVAWAATVAVTAAVTPDNAKAEYVSYACIPIGGPWVIIANDNKGDYTGPLVVSGVVQGAGLVMTVLGVSIRRRVPAYSLDLGGGQTATVEPWLGAQRFGVAGSF